jgi:hypothetical protein
MTSYLTDIFTQITDNKFQEKQKRNIWENSKWAHIAELENDDVGKVGEETINCFCKRAGIPSNIDGSKTKEQNGGGKGDGSINNKSVEIKTARLGSSNSSFQHELGENPWSAKYMLFLDIAPDKMYITIFPNFSEDFYKKSGCDSKIKCEPYFPSKSITWRKQKGAFKLDTSIAINESNGKKSHTFVFDSKTNDFTAFREYVNRLIPPSQTDL